MKAILFVINSCTKFKINYLKECRRSGTSELQKITKLSIIGHFDDFQEIWAWPTRVQNLKIYFLKYSIVHFRPISSITELHRSKDILPDMRPHNFVFLKH